MIQFYCIPNCDSCKKARKWLDSQDISYQLIDVKKQPPGKELLANWLQQVDENILLNKRGRMWRLLTDADKLRPFIELLDENPTMMKRPVLVQDDKILVGFKDTLYQEYFSV